MQLRATLTPCFFTRPFFLGFVRVSVLDNPNNHLYNCGKYPLTLFTFVKDSTYSLYKARPQEHRESIEDMTFVFM